MLPREDVDSDSAVLDRFERVHAGGDRLDELARLGQLTINGGTNLSLVSAMGIATVNVLRAHSWALGADLDEVEACHKSFAVTMSVAFRQGGFSEVRYSG